MQGPGDLEHRGAIRNGFEVFDPAFTGVLMGSQVMMADHAFLIRTPEEAVQRLNEWSGREMTAESLRGARARLADTSRQEAKRRCLLEILGRPDPIWNPAQHPELDAEGGAAAWVKRIRREAERASAKRTHTRNRE